MTDSDPDQLPRPLQQRLSLERRKNYAIYQICFTTIFTVWWTILLVFEGGEPFRWIIAGGFAALAIWSIFSLRNALRALRAFDSQRTADAQRTAETPPTSSTFDAGTENPLR